MHSYIKVILIVVFALASCSATHQHEVMFFDEFCIKPKTGFIYKTCKNVEVQVDDMSITIPAGFETDLASIPRWYWSILSPNNAMLVAPAILHDYLYSCDYGLSRDHIDDIFYEALIANSVPYRTAQSMYAAVRIFGGVHFHPKVKCTVAATFD
jgi:hypothetical protein